MILESPVSLSYLNRGLSNGLLLMVKRDDLDLIEMRACLHTLSQLADPDKY